MLQMFLLPSCVAEFKMSDGCWLKFLWKYNNINNKHLNLYINLIFYWGKNTNILLWCFSQWYFQMMMYYNGHTWTILLIQTSKVSGTTHPRCTHLRFMWLAMLRIVSLICSCILYVTKSNTSYSHKNVLHQIIL